MANSPIGNDHCKLCGGIELPKVRELAPQAIAEVYASLYGLDLRKVDCDLPIGPVAMLRCQGCHLVQFSPDWIGSAGLYEALREFPWYYQESKHEFQVAEKSREFLLDMLAAAKPGGLIVFSVPNEDSFLRYEVNNVTNLPPHHATRWCDATFRRLGALIGAQLIDVAYEPLTRDHRSAYANAQIWRAISSVFPAGRSGVFSAASNKLSRRLISLAGLPIRLWISMSSAVLRGHTVVVTLRKA